MPSNLASQPEPPQAASSSADEIARRIEAQLNLQRLAGDNQAAGQSGDPLRDLRSRQWVNSHLPIGWPHMPKGLLLRLIAILQKVTRRLLRWYIAPLVAQQNEFNEAAVTALQDVYRHIERQVATARSEREDLVLAMRRIAASQTPQAVAPNPGESRYGDMAMPFGLTATSLAPALEAARYDALLRRLLLAQQLQPEKPPLPLLIIADHGECLADRAREMGITAYTVSSESLPDYLSARVAHSLAGIIWAGGIWRHTPIVCLQLFAAAGRSLAAHAPLVVESVDTTDAAAMSRYVWADWTAVRPYPRELVMALLRSIGLVEVGTLEEPRIAADDSSRWFAIIGYRDDD